MTSCLKSKSLHLNFFLYRHFKKCPINFLLLFQSCHILVYLGLPVSEILKVWACDHGGSKILSKNWQDQNYFTIKLRHYLLSLSHFPMSIEWNFPEATHVWNCNRMDTEADMRIQLTSFEPDIKEILKKV